MSAPTVFLLQPVRTAESFSSLLRTRFQDRAKRGRGKAVSWLPEDQICQIRFFSSNDAPSALGSAQSVLQSNQSRNSPTQDGSLDIPPGFHGSLAKRAKVNTIVEVSMSIGTQWSSPQKFVNECEWLVADGGESNEVILQQQRELRLLETFYPRLTSVPDSPAEPAELSKCLDDNVIPMIPLVPIEDEDESGEVPEHNVNEEFESAMAVAEYGKPNDEQKSHGSTSGCIARSQDSSEQVQGPTISEADTKVAAAACMALQKFAANGLIDQELLVEILRNPAFLKNLTSYNASRKDLARPVNGNEVGAVGHSNINPHNSNEYGGPLNKAPFNTGLPSPVSVLSDWTPEHSTKFVSRPLSNGSDLTSETSNAKNVSSCILSAPFRHSRGAHPSREDVMHMDSVSAPLQEAHASTQGSHVGMKASHVSNKVSAQSASVVMHGDGSCGMLAPLAPFPSQKAVNFNSSALGRMQPSHVTLQVGVMHDGAPCRSASTDASSRGLQKENPGLGSMSKKGPKATRLCMYFNTPRGCRNGGNCAFLHQSFKQELNTIAQ